MKRLFLILCILLGALTAGAKSTVEATIDSIQILIGQQAHVTLTITTGYKDRCELPPFKAGAMVLPNVELLEISKPDTTDRDGNRVLTQVYTFTSFDTGLYYLPPLPVKINGKTVKSESLALKVLTIDVDTTKLDEFFPIKDVQDNPFRWSDYYPLMWTLLLLVVCIVGFIYLWKRLKDNKPVFLRRRIVKVVPAHTKALTQLQELKAEKVDIIATEEGNKEYYTRLTDTLRQYLKERFGFDATQMTTSEIVDALKAVPNHASFMHELQELFQTADLVKFAKYTTLLNQNDMNLADAIEFINSTKTEEQAREDVVTEELSSNEQRSMLHRRIIKISIALLSAVALGGIGYMIYKMYDLFI